MNGSSWEKEFKTYASLQEKASAQRIKEKVIKRAASFEKTGRTILKRRIGLLAAALILLLTGTGLAVSLLTHPDHQTGRYLLTLPEKRDNIPELEEAISGTDARIEDCRVELLGEYKGGYNSYEESYNKDIPAWRLENGFPEWDPEKFAFLYELEPKECEAYYDGTRLYINTCFGMPQTNGFSEDGETDREDPFDFDMILFDCSAEVDGNDCTALLHSGGWGSGMVWDVAPEEGEGTERKFWVSSEFDMLPAPLENGVCRVTLQYYIYDASIDDLGSVGNIARVLCTVAFETGGGARNRETSAAVNMHGDYVMTLNGNSAEEDKLLLENRTVSLEGMVLQAEAKFTPGDTVVKIRAASLPEGRNEEWLSWFFMGPGSGIQFDLYINGEAFGKPVPLSSASDEYRLELPVLPSDYPGITEIRLVPHLTYITAVTPCAEDTEPGKPVPVYEKIELIPGSKVLIDSFTVDSEDTVIQDMPGCDIVLSLPAQ